MHRRLSRTVWTAAAVVASLGVAAASHADVITAFDTAGIPNNSNPLPASTLDANLESGTALGRQGVTWVHVTNNFAGYNFNVTDNWNHANDYFTFTITPKADHEITITSLSYCLGGLGNAPNNGRWGYTTTGGATAGDWVLEAEMPIVHTSSRTLQTWDLPDVTTSGPIEFRFWAYSSTKLNGDPGDPVGEIRLGGTSDEIVVNGTVSPVPEPASLMLVGAGLLCVVARRRSH